MALPISGNLSLKNTAGVGRDISLEVEGSVITGNKSLASISVLAGKTTPHAMTEFFGYGGATLAIVGGEATATYAPLSDERNKNPFVTDITISANGVLQAGTILTATIVGGVSGPFSIGTHQYQWYRVEITKSPTLIAIAGATLNQYTLVAGDALRYFICAARFVQVSGINTMSPWFYSEMTNKIAYAADGDIVITWEDFFNFENGVSVPADWNTVGISPELLNIGTASNWTAASASKPVYTSPEMIWTKTSSHQIKKAIADTHPPVYEVWIKGNFVVFGTFFAQGSGVVLSSNSSNQYVVAGMPAQAGDLLPHVFRIVMNGAASKFQVDKGVETTFTETTSLGTFLSMGTTYSGGSACSFKAKRVQRTPDGTILTALQVADKWLFHGFP